MNAQSTVTLNSGNTMPVIGLGTWQLIDNTAEIIAKALQLGYRMIDTSGDYGTQPGIGHGIKLSDIDRGKLFITTKVEESDNAYEATCQNLKELSLQYADLMLIHRPPQNTSTSQRLWESLIRAKTDGYAKDIGVSNYSIDQMQDLIEFSAETPVVNQIEWTPFGYSQEMFSYCKEQSIIIQAYSPLTRSARQDDNALEEIAEHYDKSPAQILIRWNLQLGTVPLPKANQIDHLKENLDVFNFEITDDDMDTLNSLNEAYSALGTLSYV